MSVATITAIVAQYKYVALVVLSFFEGPYIMMISGILVKLGLLTLIPTFIAVSIGDLLADVGWYYIGHHFGNRFIRRFGKHFDITEEKAERAKTLFSKHRRKILLVSKATAGFGLSIATLIAAGIAGVPFGEYLALNVIGQIVWTALMLVVGYSFGNLYVVINNTLGRVFIIGLAVFALYLILRLSRHFGKRANELVDGVEL